MEGDAGGSGVEVLIFNFAHCAAVGGVGIVRTEALYIKPVRPPADFLIGGKADFQGSVLAALPQQNFGGSQNFRHTGLVVRAQQGRAVGDDQVLALVVGQRRVITLPEIDALFLVQQDISPVEFHDPGLDIGAAGIRSGIHVGNQADCRHILFPRRWGNVSVYVTVFIYKSIGYAKCLQLLDQFMGKIELAGTRRMSLGIFITGRQDADVAKESFNSFHR